MFASSWRNFGRYWHTLKYLRPVQIYRRIWFRFYKPRPDFRPAPERATPSGFWHVPARRLPTLTGSRSWTFLNETGHLDELGWEGPERGKLWRYHQHYFDDLNAQGAEARQVWHAALILDWIAHNQPGEGTGWEPYPLSLRAINWMKWALGGALLDDAAFQSLAIQIRWLTSRLEYHLLGNHLFTNAKALVMAGLFFDGPESNAWLAKGLAILANEVPEQLLADGGHFERSTLYHLLALEDLLDLVNISRCFPSRLSPAQKTQLEGLVENARAMRAWMLTMCHPDKEISFFNDAAFDVAPAVTELDCYARRVLGGRPKLAHSSCAHLRDSGYIRLSHGRAVALLDVAPVGPDYLPGHAHADTLSFELSVGDQRVLVNSGTSCYGSSAERVRQRGTAAHNTVVVDTANSSEVWGGFRVARRAYPFDLQVEQSELGATEVQCAHNGYARLPERPIHHRTWRMQAAGMTVIDRIEGQHEAAEARFHFHPGLRVKASNQQSEGVITMHDGSVVKWQLDRGKARLVPSTWHPRFGHCIPNLCLVVDLLAGGSDIHFFWASTWR